MVQLINISEEQLSEMIQQTLSKELAEIKKDFQPKQPTEYLTREETSKLLNVNLSTLWNWSKKGKLQAFGIGNRVYYKRSDVEAAFKPL